MENKTWVVLRRSVPLDGTGALLAHTLVYLIGT